MLPPGGFWPPHRWPPRVPRSVRQMPRRSRAPSTSGSVQLASTGGGQACSEIAEPLSRHACEQLQGAEWQRQLLWQAWLRKLDRLDPGYRD